MKPKQYFAVIILIIILAAIWWVLTQFQPKTPDQPVNQEQAQNSPDEEEPVVNAPPATNQITSNDSIVVSDQANGSDSVVIDNINIGKPGFVIITIPGTAGKPNQIIGQSGLLSSGAKQDLDIVLKNGVTLNSDLDYTAQLYTDNGDKKFDASTDTIVRGDQAQAIFSAE